MLKHFNAYVTGISDGILFIISSVFVVLIGFVDHWTGPEISFSLFYLIPIAFSAWYGKKGYGQIISVISAVIWMAADIRSGHLYSHILIPLWNGMVRLAIFLIITELLTRLRNTFQQEQHLAHTDALTGLANSRSFYQHVDRESERSRRYNHPLTIAYFDLDNFKTVNDIYGHDTGDSVLRTVGELLQVHVRKTDVVARLGGDEFAGLFPETDYEAAKAMIEKILSDLLNAMKKRGWPVTFSIGALAFSKPLDTAREMIKAADDLMYRVKKEGKNNIIVRNYDAAAAVIPGSDPK